MQIWDDKFIPGLKQLTDAVHQYGAKIAPQLYHCGRQTSPMLLEEMCPGGREISETRAVCRMLEEAGADAIDMSVANYYSFHYNVATHSVAPGFNLINSEEVKKSVSIPVIGVGRINTPAIGEDAILTGKADIIGFGRGSIADPYLPNKTMAGEAAHIAPCTGCLEGCVGHIFNPDPEKKVTCIINPFAGREGEWFNNGL